MIQNPAPEAKLPLDPSNFPAPREPHIADLNGERRAPIVYLCHAITGPLLSGGPNHATWINHRESVHQDAIELSRFGLVPIVPEALDPNIEHSEALRLDRSLVACADALYIHQSIYYSKGVEMEKEMAAEFGLPIYYEINQEMADALYRNV